MPSTRYWVGGSGSQVWTSTANWSASDGGATGASVPVSGDTAYVTRGRSNIQGSDQSAVVLAYLLVSFNGTMGASASPFKIGIAAPATAGMETCKFIGEYGDCYLSIAHATSGCTTQILGSGNVFLSAMSALGSFIFGELGRISIAASVAWPSTATDASFTTLGANVTVDTGATYPVSYTVQGGSVQCAQNTSSVEVMGGNAFTTGSATVASAKAHNGATYFHQSGGTITLCTTYKGGIASAQGATLPFAVTTGLKYAGSVLFDQPPVAVTIGNLIPVGNNN